MSRLAKSFALLLSFTGLLLGATNAMAAACTSVASGIWSAQTTWGAAGTGCVGATGGIPGAVDTVTIGATHTVTLTANAAASTLTIAAATAANGVTLNGFTLNVGGAVVMTAVSTNAITSTFNVGAGTLTATSITINGGAGSRIAQMTVSTGTITTTGNISFAGTAANARFVSTGASMVNVGGSFGSNGTLTTGGTGTINFNGGAAQTIGVYTTYNNVQINNTAGGAQFTAGTTMIGGTLQVQKGTLDVRGVTLTVTGATTVSSATSSTLLFSTSTTGTKTFTGDVTIGSNGTLSATVAETVAFNGNVTNSGGTWSETAAAVMNYAGNLQNDGAAWTASTGVHTFSGAGKTISGTLAVVIPSVTVSGTYQNNGTLTIATALAGAGTLTNSAAGILNIGGTSSITILANAGTATITGAGAISTVLANFTNSGTINLNGTGTITGITNSGTINLATSGTITALTNNAAGTLNISTTPTVPTITTLTATAPGNTVNYSGAGGQTVKATTYSNLGLSGSGAKAMGATTINGNFIMSGTATTAPTGALTVGGNFSIGAGNTFANGANALNVAGNFDQGGTFTAGAGVVTLNGGAAVQTISGAGPLGFANLTINNTGGITLARNVTVTSTIIGAHTLTSTCPTDWTLTSNGGATVEHSCPSTVTSIILANCTPTAATVQWTVTFNESVTGVDATAFSLAPTGLSGAYITTVSGGGASWTVTANTGIGSGSLGLNQSGPGSVVPPLNGTFTGAVCTITATPALAEYRMDEASWNGTANEVVDNSGSGNHAQAFNSANTTVVTGQEAKPGNPGTCRYGVFDNGGTITQGYVQTPLPNLTTDFTITAWIRTTNNAATGQRILIDDQNNTGGYGFSLGDGAAGIIRFYSRGITPVILDSTYTIANNTWYFVAAVADITNRIRTIYVYNAAGTLLASTSDSAAFTGTWGTDAGPVSIGAETNASAETPVNFHFRGNLDEVRVYQKVLSQSALAAIVAQTHACPINIPDHLEIQSGGSGLTCAASTLTIKACTDAAVPCATPYTSGVSGTLTATGAGMTVDWDGTTGGAAGAGFVIPNGSSSVTKNVQVATAGSVVFGITSPSPVPASATACNFGAPACTFTASLAGFIYSDTTTGNSYTIPAQVSGIATPTLYLRAVQAATTNPAVCTPAIISQTIAVNMGYVCNNPATCQAGNLATITNTITSTATAIAPSGTAVSLNFDANGSAPITARYDDVGQITLNASKTVTPFGGATAVTLAGNSNPFVVAPHHFGFSSITPGLIKAGNNFSATVTAYNGLATPTATPNFGKESVAEGVTLTPNLVAGNNPAISNNVIPGSEFGAGGMVNDANGVATVNNLSWGEVGLITITANLTNGSYLGAGLTASGTSGNVGRFIPDHFDTVTSGGMPCPTGLTCPTQFNGFVYSGQPFAAQVTALNLAGGTTLNYDSTLGYSKAVTLSAWDAAGGATANPGGGALTVNTIPSASFSLGAAATSTPTYTFATVPTAPTNIFVRADESAGGDGVTSLRGVSSVEGGMKIVSGRIKISNAHGSELLQLPVGVTVQYWNGTSYVTSTTDSLTTFGNANVVFSNWQKLTPASGWAAGSTSVAAPPASVAFTNGVGSFKLSKPGSGNTGSVDMTTSAPAYLPSNTGRATFGVYKGSNNFIYLRENY